MQEAAESEHIELNFNRSGAPNFGGLLDTGIHSVQIHLSRVISEKILAFEELYTILVQIEAL